jgi:hypothetical protein
MKKAGIYNGSARMVRSVLIPIYSRNCECYSVRDDAVVHGEQTFCVRIRLGWPLIRWGWKAPERIHA